jgi:hypothetical protein
MSLPPEDANPYSPPKADVALVQARPDSLPTPPFFAVSTTKLTVMYFCTFSLYQYYWLYKNWAMVKARTGENITPALRTFFAPIFCYSLFTRIRQHEAAAPEAKLAAGPLAVGWILLSYLWNLPEPYFLIAFLALVPLLTVQTAVNDINAVASPGHDPNNRFSPVNWAGIGLGGLFLLLALIGVLTGPPAPR